VTELSKTTNPNYSVTIGSEKFSIDKKPSRLVSIKVALGIGLPTDRCEVLLVSSDSYSFKKGDSFKVELGYDADLKLVFSGLVEEIERLLSKVKVIALGVAVLLLRLRFNRVYLNQTAGKIVSSIAQEAKVKIKKASDGVSFPTYVVDEVTNAYEHVLKLAERCNFDAYFNEEEQLVFKEWGGGKNTSLQYGKEIIGVRSLHFSPLYVGTRVYGESPSSMKGSDTSHWLTKQEVKAEAGGKTSFQMEDPAVKDRKTAETVAKAKTFKLEYTFGVAVKIVGNAGIRIGDTITLKDVPIPNVGGELEVRGVRHYLSKAKGFTTTINCWGRPSA
jgi:phage protein D